MSYFYEYNSFWGQLVIFQFLFAYFLPIIIINGEYYIMETYGFTLGLFQEFDFFIFIFDSNMSVQIMTFVDLFSF